MRRTGGPYGGAHFWKVVSSALSTTTKGWGEVLSYHMGFDGMHALYEHK